MTPDRARPRLQSQPWCRRVPALIERRRFVAAVLVGVVAAGLPSPVVASSGGGRQITDAENTRTVYLVVTALVLLAVGLAVFTWWFWRSTRREPEALAPLEVMGDRKFVAGDLVARQVMLDGNRPVGAAPLPPGAPEPLMVETSGDTDVDAAPATLVVAAIGAGAVPASTNGDVETTSPDLTAPSDGDATAVVPAQSAGESEDQHQASEAEEASEADADELAAVDAAEVAHGPADVEVAAAEATDVPADVGVAAAEAAEETEAAPTEAAPSATTNGAGAAPTPIDPGLPVPPVDEEPVRHLSLAELVALQPESPIGFEDGELASTPSTGIPVIESAEAWLERQLAASKVGATEIGDSGAASPDDDPDEPTPAAVHGAD